jgi:hypothetical protein
MTRGESLRVLIDYDLFGTNAKGEVGVYLKTDQVTNKHLVYFLEIEEWGEFKDEWVERVDPDKVPPVHEELVSRITTLKITY